MPSSIDIAAAQEHLLAALLPVPLDSVDLHHWRSVAQHGKNIHIQSSYPFWALLVLAVGSAQSSLGSEQQEMVEQ